MIVKCVMGCDVMHKEKATGSRAGISIRTFPTKTLQKVLQGRNLLTKLVFQSTEKEEGILKSILT